MKSDEKDRRIPGEQPDEKSGDSPWARSRRDPSRYEDLLDRERPVLPGHPPMASADRAAQFSPFAALTGFEEVLRRAAAESERENR